MKEHKHCFHYSGQSQEMKGPDGRSYLHMPEICCWCAPEYMRVTIRLQAKNEEDFNQIKAGHGPRVHWYGIINTGIVLAR